MCGLFYLKSEFTLKNSWSYFVVEVSYRFRRYIVAFGGTPKRINYWFLSMKVLLFSMLPL
jgi:hypothetical protein